MLICIFLSRLYEFVHNTYMCISIIIIYAFYVTGVQVTNSVDVVTTIL
jgi:hypothetical protein